MDDRSPIDLWYRRLPRYLYLEELIENREVVEIGCALGVGCDFFAERGARSVRGVDRDEAVLERARRRYGRAEVEFHRWRGGLPFRDASADFIAVPEAGQWLDEAGFLDELRRVLKPAGRLLVAVPNGDRPEVPGGVSYYELYERLEPLFPPIRMIGQTPFLAYGLVEYQDEEPDLALDTSLCEGNPEAVSHYVALGGPPELDEPTRGYTIMQIPFAPLE